MDGGVAGGGGGTSRPGTVADRLRQAFGWRSDRSGEHLYAEVTGWWRDPALLAELGPALAGLFRDDDPTVVLGLESRGCLLGPLVAVQLGLGFVEVRKDQMPSADTEPWRTRLTPPDYRDRRIRLGFAERLVSAADRVILVDDWVDTGGQATGVRLLVEDAGARWLGVAAVVDALDSQETRQGLGVRSLLRGRDLG